MLNLHIFDILNNIMEDQNIQNIIQFKQGNPNAFNILVKDNLKSVLNFVYRYIYDTELAEDITQEVFIKVWKNISKFDTSKNFKPWLFKIARNTALDFIKKRKLIPFSSFENDNEENHFINNLEDQSKTLLEEINLQEQKEFLNDFLQELKPNQQLVFFLYYYEELTFKEISETLSISINTIKSRHLRGLEKLKAIMHQN